MNRRGRCAALACVVAFLAVSALAGYVHFNGKTYFIPHQAVSATIWERQNATGNLYLLPNGSVQIFDNTLHVITGGVSVVSMGYWMIDANGNYTLKAGIDASYYTMRYTSVYPIDCEFEVDANGNVIPKEYKR